MRYTGHFHSTPMIVSWLLYQKEGHKTDPRSSCLAVVIPITLDSAGCEPLNLKKCECLKKITLSCCKQFATATKKMSQTVTIAGSVPIRRKRLF